MDNDSIEHTIDLVAQQYSELIQNHAQTLTEISLRQAAIEDHVGTSLVSTMLEIREELRRLSSRLDAMEGRLAIALESEHDGVPATRP